MPLAKVMIALGISFMGRAEFSGVVSLKSVSDGDSGRSPRVVPVLMRRVSGLEHFAEDIPGTLERHSVWHLLDLGVSVNR
jgi:hypothetical protein